jgi:hypothetical protein
MQVKVGFFFLLHSFQIGSGAQPFFWSLDIGDFSIWVKEPGHEADHNPHVMPRLRMNGALPPLLHVYSLHARGHLIQECLEQKLYITMRSGRKLIVVLYTT